MGAEVSGQFGGRITCKFGSVTIPVSDAEIVIDPAIFDVTAGTNQDGTPFYTLKMKNPGADVKFRNVGDVNWAQIGLQTGNATFTELDGGRTHLFSGTRLIGNPKINTSTGEVDGLRFEGGTYQFIANS